MVTEQSELFAMDTKPVLILEFRKKAMMGEAEMKKKQNDYNDKLRRTTREKCFTRRRAIPTYEYFIPFECKVTLILTLA